MSPSVYAKAHNISIETKCRGVRPFSLFVKTNSPDVLNVRRHSSRCPGRGFAGELRPIVLTFLDIYKHLMGLKSVDKIKKYRRDIPRGFLSTSAVDSHRSRRLRWLSTSAVDKNLLGNPSRYSLSLYHWEKELCHSRYLDSEFLTTLLT